MFVQSSYNLSFTITKLLTKWQSIPKTGINSMHMVTLIEGNGIGPEITRAVKQIFKCADVPIKWENVETIIDNDAAEDCYGLSCNFLQSARNNKIILKGPLATPIGKGYRSLNLRIRKALDLFANVRPCKSITALPARISRYKNVNLVTFRENTEGEYCGIEHELKKHSKLGYKIITEKASNKIANFAFNYAANQFIDSKKTITVVHQMDYLPVTDGLFVSCCEREAEKYTSKVSYNKMDLSQICKQLIIDPSKFDILLMPNLYGDIISDLCAGMIGGLGLTPSANIGISCAMFEAVHGSAPDIANKDLANPIALLLSGLMMLDHMGLTQYSRRIRFSLQHIIENENHLLTRDLGGQSKCTEFTNHLCSHIKNNIA
ncbi:hypothetical protein GJ496_010579 [Pomphorhynchus laevis]|nr:hypothetical protein GJ496_010579 [Pomphorhynchus laevis]